MLLGVIADDFTGASDIANTLANTRADARSTGDGPHPGLATTLFLRVPEGDADPACEAGVVALKTRSVPAAEAVERSLAALAWLRRQGCRQIVFKYCSTFDSTPAGNIGPVGEALAAALGAKGVVACPAFPATGRTLYAGHLFVGDVPLAESSLRHHPLNPMTDSDLRRWLARQSRDPVGHVPWRVVRAGPAQLREALDAAARRGETLVIVDAIADEDLLAIGEACADAPLITGGSGIALGLGRNLRRAGSAPTAAGAFRPAPGPKAVLAGSCSEATLAQIARHGAAGHPVLAVDPDAAVRGEVAVADLVRFVRENRDRAPLVRSSAGPGDVRAVQARHGAEAVAAALDGLFAATARALVADGVRRLVVAGGETSGAVVSALGLDALAIGPEIAPGVPALSAVDGPPLALALKSGNFGGADFFAAALATLGGDR